MIDFVSISSLLQQKRKHLFTKQYHLQIMLHPLEIELRHRIRQDCYSTAYPWDPKEWSAFLQPGQLKFSKDDTLSFYIHIPFCKSLCNFCEYTRCLVPDDNIQRNYLQILHRDIRRFLLEHPNITLEGFDIGGGTPTALSPVNFAYLMQIYKEVINRVNISDDFEPSIEASYKTITPEKIKMIRDAGIRRISIGIQTRYFFRPRYSEWQHPEVNEIINCIRDIRNSGWFKINLNFTYGFKYMRYDDIDIFYKSCIEQLTPDQVTLYELRTNQLKDYEVSTPDNRNSDYSAWYNNLIQLGYLGRYGQNTFSIDRHDLGVSSYIRHRMLNGGNYKGFGISAQSMSDGNLEYNAGKNATDILSLIPTGRRPKNASFDATEHYELPVNEKFAKFVCISAHSGGFNWRIAKDRFYPDFFQRFGPTLDFLSDSMHSMIDRGYLEITNDCINLTRNGFRHYGPILSLFYKPELITAK